MAARKTARKITKKTPKKGVRRAAKKALETLSQFARRFHPSPCPAGQALLAEIEALEDKGLGPAEILKHYQKTNPSQIEYLENLIDDDDRYGDGDPAESDTYFNLTATIDYGDGILTPAFIKAAKAEIARIEKLSAAWNKEQDKPRKIVFSYNKKGQLVPAYA